MSLSAIVCCDVAVLFFFGVLVALLLSEFDLFSSGWLAGVSLHLASLSDFAVLDILSTGVLLLSYIKVC